MSKVKITFPKKKETIKIFKYESLYIVICKFKSGAWGIGDFWDLPYISTSYLKAVKFKNLICKKATKDFPIWKKEYFVVMKIAFKSEKKKEL